MTAQRLYRSLIVLFIVFAIGPPWGSEAQQPIRIGASLSLTGKYALQGGYARVQWQDGKQVVVGPDDLAAGKPRFPTPPWSGR